MPHSVDRYLKIYLAGTSHDTSWPLEGSQGTTLPRPRGVSSSTRHKTAVSRTSKATIPQGRTFLISSSSVDWLIRIMLYQFDSAAFQSQLSTCWFYWIWERTHTSPIDSIGFRTKNSCHLSCIVGAFPIESFCHSETFSRIRKAIPTISSQLWSPQLKPVQNHNCFRALPSVQFVGDPNMCAEDPVNLYSQYLFSLLFETRQREFWPCSLNKYIYPYPRPTILSKNMQEDKHTVKLKTSSWEQKKHQHSSSHSFWGPKELLLRSLPRSHAMLANSCGATSINPPRHGSGCTWEALLVKDHAKWIRALAKGEEGWRSLR